MFFNQFDYVPRCHKTRIRNVVNAKWRAQSPSVKTRANKIRTMRNGIYVVINLVVTLHFAQIISRIIKLIERNPQPPDVTLANAVNCFLAQRLAAAVKTARLVAE